MSIETPNSTGDADEAVPSTVKRAVQRQLSMQNELIESIRSELFSPPPAAKSDDEADNDAQSSPDNLYDDGELKNEILRLPSVEDDIRQDLNAQMHKFSGKAPFIAEPERNSGLVLLVLFFWLVVYLKEWRVYAPEQMQE